MILEDMVETKLILIGKPLPGIALVTLNRPASMNALSAALCQQLASAMRDLSTDGTRVVILTGAGRAFCAGVDLKEVSETSIASIGRAVLQELEAFPGAIIGAINGVAVTGGFEIALACDVLVAAETARFADTHGLVGFLPDWGLSQKLSRVVGLYRAKDISLTGRYVSAHEAHQLGIVSEVVPADQLLEAAMMKAKAMLANQPGMLEALKSLMNAGYDLPFGAAKEEEHKRASSWNNAVEPAIISNRRQGVLAHGRQQTTGDDV